VQVRDKEQRSKPQTETRASDGALFDAWLKRKSEEAAQRQRDETIRRELLAEAAAVRACWSVCLCVWGGGGGVAHPSFLNDSSLLSR
jgi:hypothetical protein